MRPRASAEPVLLLDSFVDVGRCCAQARRETACESRTRGPSHPTLGRECLPRSSREHARGRRLRAGTVPADQRIIVCRLTVRDTPCYADSCPQYPYGCHADPDHNTLPDRAGRHAARPPRGTGPGSGGGNPGPDRRIRPMPKPGRHREHTGLEPSTDGPHPLLVLTGYHDSDYRWFAWTPVPDPGTGIATLDQYAQAQLVACVDRRDGRCQPFLRTPYQTPDSRHVGALPRNPGDHAGPPPRHAAAARRLAEAAGLAALRCEPW
jgi:hypothetical protein